MSEWRSDQVRRPTGHVTSLLSDDDCEATPESCGTSHLCGSPVLFVLFSNRLVLQNVRSLRVDSAAPTRDGCVERRAMDVDTKFLRLRKQTTLGDDIDGWRVCWLGGWSRDQLFYMVMVVRAKAGPNSARVIFRCGADVES